MLFTGSFKLFTRVMMRLRLIIGVARLKGGQADIPPVYTLFNVIQTGFCAPWSDRRDLKFVLITLRFNRINGENM